VDVLFETEVTPDQIDHLGHMNVRYYAAHARAGAERLFATLGLVPDEGRTVVQRDSYVRHHREQLVGARLEVRGAVLSASSDGVRVYEELVNAQTDEVAATFVLSFETSDRATRDRVGIEDAVVAAARAATTTLPDHGKPRSISLDEDPAARAPTLDVLRHHDLALRQVRPIDPAECDVDGYVLALAVPELVWGGEPVPGRAFRPLEELADGGQMGFATMETRATWVRLARVGERVQSFGAELEIREKTMLGRHWLLDVERGDLVAVFSVVSLAFDTATRRAVVIPDEVRRRMVSRLHPEFGHSAST
jgi:acyl-CoA thioester hydrolase